MLPLPRRAPVHRRSGGRELIIFIGVVALASLSAGYLVAAAHGAC